MLWSIVLLGCRPPADTCEGPVAHVYDPLVSQRLDAWPDDVFTVADDASPTGRRVSVLDTPWFGAQPELLQDIAADVEGASGFGTKAELILRFDGPVGDLPSVEDSTTTSAVQLWALHDPPVRVAYEASLAPGGQQVQLLPVTPLQPGTPHALVVTRDQPDADGRCMAPSPVLKAVLDHRADDPWRDQEKPVRRLLRDLDVDAADVTALLRFTTHADHLDYFAAGAEARDTSTRWTDTLACEQRDGHRFCTTAFDPLDFRGPDELVVPGSTTRTTVPVSFWLPDGVEDPPLVVYGHGLGQRREDGDEVADLLLPLGIALVGADALYHGDHPTSDGTSDPTAFLGLQIEGGIAFDLKRLRSAFDQSNLDRRQLLTLLTAAPDVDGDGTPEFDPTRIGYVGISLGGILGSGLFALSDELDVGVFAIAGGNLSTIVRDTEAVAAFRPLFVQLAGGEEQLAMTFSLLQTAIDPSDPTLYATSVLRDRASGPAPHLLVPVATGDEVVPFAAGRALARALGVPHVPPVVVPVPGLETTDPPPVATNGPDGATTGYFQFDRMTRDGALQPSRHLLPRAIEFETQLIHFLSTWVDGEPVIADPYATLATPPLP
jgi:dienelactone hydrolase